MVAGLGGEIATIAATGIIHNSLSREGSTVGAYSGEGKEGLIHKMSRIFYSINSATAAHSKEDIGLLNSRQIHEHMAIFVSAFTAVPNEVQNFNIRAGNALNNSVLRFRQSSFTANNGHLFTQKARCMGNLLIGIGTNGVG